MVVVRVAIGARGARPIDELDALLERRRTLAHEPGFIDAEGSEGLRDGGERSFTDPDGRNVGGFDERDARTVRPLPERLGEKGGGEPTGRSATDDENVGPGALHPA